MRVVVTGLLLFGAASAFVKVPSEPDTSESEEYDPENVLQSRAEHVKRTCWKYGDFSRPEHLRMSLKEATSDAANPAVVFNIVEPAFQVCSPTHSAVGADVWRDWKTQAEAVLGDEAVKSGKGLAKRMKVLSVEHPFHRLARAYLKTFKAEASVKDSGDEYKELRRVYRKAKGEMLTFKDMIRFLTRGAADFGPDSAVVTSWDVYGEMKPYYEACPVCHKDLYPSFVIKTDSPNLESDLEFVQEMFGLEETEFPMQLAEEPVPDSMLGALYRQLDIELLDSLVEFYRVDLEMFRYSPDSYYEMLQE